MYNWDAICTISKSSTNRGTIYITENVLESSKLPFLQITILPATFTEKYFSMCDNIMQPIQGKKLEFNHF